MIGIDWSFILNNVLSAFIIFGIFTLLSFVFVKFFIRSIVSNILEGFLSTINEVKEVKVEPSQLPLIILQKFLEYYGLGEFAPVILPIVQTFLSGMQPKRESAKEVWG